MNLLLFNLATDLDDPLLGFTSGWVRQLADRVESIHVITMRAGRVSVPSNVEVHSVGKELGYSEFRRGINFYRILAQVLRTTRIDACFSHMMPLFTVLGAPMLRPRRIPIVTWYTHPQLTWTLRIAHWMSQVVVTSLPNSYPYRREKLKVLGHGIDTELFTPDGPNSREARPLILCVGRLSPTKDHPTLIEAIGKLAGQARDLRLLIVGSPARPEDAGYEKRLHALVSERGLEDHVSFIPAVRQTELPSLYRRAWAHVNLTSAGFGDKVAWEAMACGTPSVVANPDYEDTLGAFTDTLLFERGDPQDLARSLSRVLDMEEDERWQMGMVLREQVKRHHSLERLVGRLEEILTDVSR